MPTGRSPPGTERRRARRSGTSGASRSTQPTTPATSPSDSAASASSHVVSASVVAAWTATVADTPAAPVTARRSSRTRGSRRRAASPVIHGYSCRPGSHRWWWAATITGAVPSSTLRPQPQPLHPAVHGQRRAGRPGRGAEVDDRLGDLLGADQPPHGLARLERRALGVGVVGLREQALHPRRVGGAGAHAVDAHALAHVV